jgi:adenine deaminase
LSVLDKYYDKLRLTSLGEIPADLLLVNGQVVNVFSGEIIRANVAISNSHIAGVGDYRNGHKIVDLQGRFLLPGLIDSHIHIESSMLTPVAFAQAALPHGTTAVLADPHEIVNVMGLEGWRYMVRESQGLPLDFFWEVPSCVPATHMETAGGMIGPEELEMALEEFPECPALAEMMNYQGVIDGLGSVTELMRRAGEKGLLLEGHAPKLSGFQLCAYLASGCGSDHECTSINEAQEKLRFGMRLLIRQGSAAQNLLELLPLVNEHNYHRCAFCCDDRHPADIVREGHMDHVLRTAVDSGFPAIRAIQMVTLNPAQHFNLKERGAVGPGYLADLVLVDDLVFFNVEMVFKGGREVARRGRNLWTAPEQAEISGTGHFEIPDLSGRFVLNPPPGARLVKVIEVIPNQVLTGSITLPIEQALQDPDINLLSVVERHGRGGGMKVGLVKGFGLARGALASSVAHDSHNLIVVGKDPTSMETAARRVAEMKGGMAVCDGKDVLASLALPVAGLMSPHPAAQVAVEHEALEAAARTLGSPLSAPFMTLSFLALPVIPELRLTDKGLVDVNDFSIVDMWE